MATTATTDTSASGSLVFERRVGHVHKYQWPAMQLNFWMIIMLVAASTIIGVFATFMQIQQQLLLTVPWSVLSTPARFSAYSGLTAFLETGTSRTSSSWGR